MMKYEDFKKEYYRLLVESGVPKEGVDIYISENELIKLYFAVQTKASLDFKSYKRSVKQITV